MLPVDITLLRMPRCESLIGEIRAHCEMLAARLTDPGHWDVVVEWRPDGDVTARVRVDSRIGCAHACGRASVAADAVHDVFFALAGNLQLPEPAPHQDTFAKAG